MPELVTYADEALPADLKRQILAAHRSEWPGGYVGENRLRDWVQRPRFHLLHLALVERGSLIGYAGVVWKHLEHAGETYETFGLSGVYTDPAFRRQGHGRRLVDAATALIQGSDPDIGLFTCTPDLVDFYAAGGWESIESAVLLGGPQSARWPTEERVMMGFFSDKGRQGRPDLESQPISFDDDLW